MTRPHILFFLCLNDRGGAELSMIRLAQGLLARGIVMQRSAVTLAVYGAQPGLAFELGFSGEVIDLGAERTAAAFWPLFNLLRARRFSHLISSLTHTNIVACFAAALARTRTRVLATEHGVDGADQCAASPFFKCIARLAYGSAASVVAVSQGLAERWRDLLPPSANVLTIYNPVMPDTPSAASPPAHQWLARKNISVVMGIGRLKAEKNFALLIRAFAALASQRDARLVILGEGEQRPMLENLAQELNVADKILMPGFVAETGGWLPHASMLVCPSRREGFGNAIVEALGCGVPVVATDCPYGPAEILDDGRYGLLVPPDDIAAMAKAMLQTLESPPDGKALRRRACDFTVSRCIDAYLRLIDNAPLSSDI